MGAGASSGPIIEGATDNDDDVYGQDERQLHIDETRKLRRKTTSKVRLHGPCESPHRVIVTTSCQRASLRKALRRNSRLEARHEPWLTLPAWLSALPPGEQTQSETGGELLPCTRGVERHNVPSWL